jgi:1,2-diacylglycerol 3-alpha-glucosyltransferase
MAEKRALKIAIFTDTYLPQMNGVVSYLVDSIRVMSETHEIVLFAPGEKLKTEAVSANFRIHWIPSSPFPFYEGYRVASLNYKRISGLLRKERPDIVHVHAPVNLGLQGMIAAKRKKIPLMVTYHTHFPDYVPHLLSGKLPSPLRRISELTVKKMIKHVFRQADIVSAPTMELVRELRSYGLQNVIHLSNGIDFGVLKCTAGEAEAFRKKHGIPKSKVALYLGRISFEKRIDRLLESIRLIEKKGVTLVVAGGGPYIDNFRKFAKLIGLRRVVFTGFVENKAAAYSCADVFVSASDSETFGLTYVEAMRMGLPVVAVSRLGAKEIVESGRNGFLSEPEDRRGFARNVVKLMASPKLRKRMSEAARESSKKYSIESSVGKTVQIYRELLE